jgi:exosortase
MQLEEKQDAPATRGFLDELRSLGEAVPHKAIFGVIFVAWIALFHFLGNPTLGYINTRSMFGWLQNAYSQSTDDNLGMLVPIAVILLLWWKREELAAAPKQLWWPPIVLFVFAALLHVAGYTVQQTRLSVVSFFLGLYAVMGLLWGWEILRATFFPFFLFAFSVPLPTDLEGLTIPLRVIAAKLAVGTSHLMGIDDLIRQGTKLMHEKRGVSYDVEAACSGMRSLTVMLAMGCIFGFVFFRKNWKRALMILSAIPLAILSNLLRLQTVVIGGTWKYDQMDAAKASKMVATKAGQDFGMYLHDHEILKYVPYVLGFAGMMLLARWLRRDDDESEQTLPV